MRFPARLSALAALTLLAPLGTVGAQSNFRKRDTADVNRSTNPVLAPFRFRSIGPASMGGRVDDIAVYEKDPRIIFIGYAAGGVFKSTNAGTSFTPIFERYSSASIGDIAVDQSNPNVVYVGTGEPNNRQTSTFGDGMYKSTDGGKSFTHIGLRETQTIARIVIDPRNTNTVYVVSPGHLFGPNRERGIYKTTDGGKSWNNIKFIDENTGFTDLVMDPGNSSVMYAASYQRRRTGCCFNGGGPGSALWKTENGGKSWSKLTDGGLPPGTYGRIAVDVARSNPKVVYAQIENDGADSISVVLGGAGGGGGGRGGYDWCSNGSESKGFGGGLPGAPAPADSTRKVPPLSRHRPGLYRSENKGKTWTLVSNCNGRPMYFSNIRVDPTNDKTVYLANVRAAKSLDGGKTFAPIDEGLGSGNEMVDQHAFWIDPANSDHILRGADAGFAITWDQGATWDYVHTMATGLAYWVSADMHRPYNVYFGLQDNDSWGGASALRSRNGIRDHNWFRIGGGDGFQTAVDPTNRQMIFSESQDGNTQRTDLSTGIGKSIRPSAPPAGRGGGGANVAAAPAPGSCVDGRIIAAPATGAAGAAGAGGGFGGRGGGAANVINAQPGDTYRFNWNTPFVLSPHSPNVIWLGGNRLFRSSDQGDMWVASADLTKQVDRCKITVMGAAGTTLQMGKNDGMTNYSTIISVSESPALAGVVWAGTDDGNVQVSRDNGVTFTEVGKNITGLPSGALSGDNPYWISRIDASHFDAATAYVAVDGHRSDDLKPYVFVTRDYGKTWSSVSTSLPASGNVQVIREDPKNPQLLYAGTEFGLFLSLNGGSKWEPFMTGYPTVRTDDILVHPRDGDLIVASHGRSIWIADDITPLQQFTPAVAAADATLFDVRAAVAYATDVRADIYTGGEKQFEGENPARGTAIQFHLKNAGEAKISIADATGRTVCETTVKAIAGINRIQWSLVTPMLTAAAPGGGRGGAPGGGGGRGAGAAAGAPPTAGANPAPPATPTPPQPPTPAPDTSCSGSAGGGRGGGGASAAPGSYIVKLSVGGKDYVKPAQVLEDRWMGR
ncbi:MAG: hypothetical protein IPP90_14755 [Gemmatimonadaceae bacterium]|nr:hypothetical protein [Gemmatimonadaceae bacterium]